MRSVKRHIWNEGDASQAFVKFWLGSTTSQTTQQTFIAELVMEIATAAAAVVWPNESISTESFQTDAVVRRSKRRVINLSSEASSMDFLNCLIDDPIRWARNAPAYEHRAAIFYEQEVQVSLLFQKILSWIWHLTTSAIPIKLVTIYYIIRSSQCVLMLGLMYV